MLQSLDRFAIDPIPSPAPISRKGKRQTAPAKVKAVCVYCGSSARGPKRHQAAAIDLGRRLAAAGIELVFGGGRVGLMGMVADAALTAGGKVTGIIPEHLLRAEVGHGSVSRLVVTKSMHTRKAAMFRRSDAFVVLPGGPGTLDEFFEIVTWRQLQLHDKPILIVNLDGYWTPLVQLIEGIVKQGYARPSFRRLFQVVSRIEDVVPTLRRERKPRVRARPKRL
jgi:uncharacterized protein (TIGR00730 family)